MGGVCCKRLEPGAAPSSPHIPFCEVVRRCARVLCPVDPPQQKPVHRIRKYGLSDIVGPVVKKDSWVQTDPLPPPRRRKWKNKQRRRSRSVEFLPYLIRRESSRTSKTSGSLEDIPGQEDALDFQMYFMSRLPRNSFSDGKDSLSGRKKEFLSGLLGEENNNLVINGPEEKILTASKATEGAPPENERVEEKKQESSVTDTASKECNAPAEPNSRRSSITESLREFESSLLDMLEEDESSLTKEVTLVLQDVSSKDEDYIKTPGEIFRKESLTPLKEEKEDDYIITPLEEEKDEDKVADENIVTKMNVINQSKPVMDETILKANGAVINISPTDEKEDEVISKLSVVSVVQSNKSQQDQPTLAQ